MGFISLTFVRFVQNWIFAVFSFFLFLPQVYMTSGKSFDITKKLQMIEQNAKNHYRGPLTDSELSDLEDQVALAAAKVQSTESEVSYTLQKYIMWLDSIYL